MLSKLKYALIVVPVFLLAAAYSAPPCYKLYDAECCALGDGSPNSGFSPGQPTECLNLALGPMPWVCPTANPTQSAQLKNDVVQRQQSCQTGQTGCWTDWQESWTTPAGKCTQKRFTCSITVHGACSPGPVQADYTCEDHDLYGSRCKKFVSDEEEEE